MQLEKKSFVIYLPKFKLRLHEWLPSKGNVLFTFLVIGSLLWVQNAGAISLGMPAMVTTSIAGIPYQGRLADKNGSPLTQTVNMIFRLYAAGSGASPLWEEQWTGANSVQVSDGLFNVMLGSLTPIPQTIITGNSNLFLGITVGTDSEMSPRVQLGSVPFATQALTVPDESITKAKLAADVSLTPPDGSITTAKLADQAVTANKVAMGQFLRLVNSSTDYKVLFGALTVTTPVEQAGTGMYYGGATLTFPTAFTATPYIVFSAVGGDNGNEVSVTARSVSNTGAVIQGWSVRNGATLTVNWIAIGQ
jgi:hypothetical protein